MANKPALKAAYDSLLSVARRDNEGNLVVYLYQAQEVAKELSYRGTEPEPDSFVTAFLDGAAELFDQTAPIHPGSLFTDPRDGEAITAQGLLERIRLGKDAKESPTVANQPAELALPDPYLLLGSAKQHLADHKPMTFGDALAWELCDRLQREASRG